MLHAGAARVEITPFWGVELAGWGYYLERRWRRIADPLYATALAVEGAGDAAILLSLDLMLADAAFVRQVREQVRDACSLEARQVLVACTHTHNGPACGGLLGVGATDPDYRRFAARQAATAAILAWRDRAEAAAATAATQVPGLQFNRTRPDGATDATLTLLRIDRVATGKPLATVVNFAAHPTVSTQLQPWSVSRDVPGQLCDALEAAAPGSLALYLQGACGDVNFLRRFQTESQRHVPGEALSVAARELLERAAPDADPTVRTLLRPVELPTRRWTREEIESDRTEAERRLREDDIGGWRETIGRSMTNRPDDMVARHGGDERRAVRAMCRFHLEWTERMLVDFQQRAETLATHTQAVRVGRWCCVSNASEFFSPFALRIRDSVESPLAIACYAGGRIGYLPDAHDIQRKTYAGYQSPKYCDQFPFTEASGEVMTEAMVAAVQNVRGVG